MVGPVLVATPGPVHRLRFRLRLKLRLGAGLMLWLRVRLWLRSNRKGQRPHIDSIAQILQG